MREFVNIPPPGIDQQIAEDMVRVLVDEQGHPDNLKTYGLAVVIRLFARLRAASRAMIAKSDHNPQEEVWLRRMIHPAPLAFWINTLVGAAGRERQVADAREVYRRRAEDLRITVLDR